MKKYLLLVILLLVPFLVKAEEYGECSTTDRQLLKDHAANVKITYVPYKESVTDEKTGELKETRLIKIKIYNVMADSFYILRTTDYGVTHFERNFDFTDIDKVDQDGTVTFIMQAPDIVVNFELEIISNYNFCTGETIKKLQLKVPKFNYYSELEACNGIPEFYMCQEYITFDIDKSTFYSRVEEYQQKKENPDLENLIINDNTPAQHEIAVIKKSYTKYIVGGVFLLLAIIGTSYLLKVRKSKQQMW